MKERSLAALLFLCIKFALGGMVMSGINLKELVGDNLEKFYKIAEKNGTSGDVVLKNFILDYVVSDGRPEKVSGSQPWNCSKK